MLKAILDKLRKTPGPAKNARVIAADILEELVDIGLQYIKDRVTDDSSKTHKSNFKADTPPQNFTSDFEPDKSGSKTVSNNDIDEKFKKALNLATNLKKQNFKILAILWYAKDKKPGFITAKEVSKLGEETGIKIRHENVRKIIRMRLSEYVEIRRTNSGGRSILNYKLTARGTNYFESNYLDY